MDEKIKVEKKYFFEHSIAMVILLTFAWFHYALYAVIHYYYIS